MCLAAAVVYMWTKRHLPFMRVKSMRFVILQVCVKPCFLVRYNDMQYKTKNTIGYSEQTFGGIMWYLGFVVRFGTFRRTGLIHVHTCANHVIFWIWVFCKIKFLVQTY